MIKKTVIVEDIFEEQPDREETFYFNLTKSELVQATDILPMVNDLQDRFTSPEGVTEKDLRDVTALIRDFIVRSYGIREGNRFIKTEQIREEFNGSPEFEAVLWDIMKDEASVAEFLIGLVPASLREEANKEAEAALNAKADETPTIESLDSDTNA